MVIAVEQSVTRLRPLQNAYARASETQPRQPKTLPLSRSYIINSLHLPATCSRHEIN